MNRRRVRGAWVCLVVASGAWAGCNQTTPLGTYAVTGDIATNTCGAGLMASNPYVFDWQIAEEGSTLQLTWDNVENAPLTSAPLASSSGSSAALAGQTTTFTGGETQAVDSACTLSRVDTIAITFGTGSPPTSLAGSVTFSFSAASGTSPSGAANDCTDQLSVSGGQYDTLPCSVEYSVTGTLQ